MSRRRVWTWISVLVAVLVAATTTTAVAVSAGNDKVAAKVKACADKQTGVLRLSKPACKPSETKVAWAKKGPTGATGPAGPEGPEGPQGPQGPAGALSTTPVNVQYQATRSTAHQLQTVGGITLNLECGTSRIGTDKADLGTFADEIHGTSTLTRYNGQVVVTATTYPIDASSSTDLDGANVGGGGVTHSTENFSAVVSEGGVVSQIDMYVTRDTRQGRPVCEFIGSVTELGPATVVPN
jgi:hypothetical protein